MARTRKQLRGFGVKTRAARRRSHETLSSRRVSRAIARINRTRRQRRRVEAHDLPVNPPPRPLTPPVAAAVNPNSFSRFSIARNFDVDDFSLFNFPISGSSNFYITPREVIEFLDNHSELFRGNMLDLRKMRAVFERWERSRIIDHSSAANRSAPDFDVDAFLENEARKMCVATRGLDRDWKYPHLIGTNGGVLSIPGRDVYDLPIFIMLYILRKLTQFPRRPSFTVGYRFGLHGDNTVYPVNNIDSGRPITVIDGMINERDLAQIYMAAIRRFAALLPDTGDDGNVTWSGGEDSGTRIILHNYRGTLRLYLELVFTPTRSVNHAHGWTQEVEDILMDSVGNAIISVRNRDDNKCLIYCIIMGLIIKIKGSARVFGSHPTPAFVESNEVFCKGSYLFSDDDEVTHLLHRLTKLLLPPTYSDGPVDPLVSFVEDIDKKAGTMISVTEFRSEFGEIETKLIPKEICGIDVYGIDFNVNSHIYPLYISKNRERTIELLCVTPLDAKCSHYCLITNMEKLLRGSGGKQFFSCSKCGQCFYHRRLLKEHKCPAQPDHYQVDGEGGYHFSNKYATPNDMICGVCSKCRLAFTDDFSLSYHKEHCLMAGQTGYRHVQLVTYKTDEHPTLNGEEIDLEAEDKHVERRRVMYADFESSINPETGEHTFMSYGIYDWKSDTYQWGYQMKDFLDFILETAYDNEEDQIYVYFHNAMGYDANFILRYVMRGIEYSSWGIQVIMKSSNKLQKLVFHTRRNDKTRAIHIGDTFLFLTLSLERIVGSIRKETVEENERIFPRFFRKFRALYPDVTDTSINHILRKNIFPYKFFTDGSKLSYGIIDFKKIFEAKEENLGYFSEHVTLEDLANGYEDTINVIETFRCLTAKDYHDLYLCCDVMQLADVFDRSMNILWDSHCIHLTKYLGMPSASWAAFLRHDPAMSIPLYEDTFFAEFFKGMIRGGITSAALRHATADDTHSIIYLDVNGLYPYVMQKYEFPCGQFTFMPFDWTDDQCSTKLNEYFDMFEREHKGMCFCVDLVIPDAVKQLTDMYPFAPEHRKIYSEYFLNKEQKVLTPFLKRWSEANNGEKMSEFTGLVCTLYNKEKYNVHWRLLKFYMEHGVVVSHVHFGVMFDEGDYLAGYIRKNIEIRNTRTDELGKTLYKLLGNSIYGKTFESPFKRNTYEIVRDPIKLQGLLEEGNIAAMIPVDDLGWIVRMDGEDIVLDKPTYIGACVCEFSKLHMYTLLYDKLMQIFPDTTTEKGCQLVYTDTDSFIVYVKHPEGVGASPEELFAYIKSKDPTLIGGIGGQVKSETGEDDTIQEVIALRSKVYAYRTKHGHIGKRAKGTTHDAQEMQLDWETYKQALESLTSINTRNMQFVRKTFKIASIGVYRQSLSVNDGKRFICKDGIHTHAFGYPISRDEYEEFDEAETEIDE